jgi:hypothetical protein
MRHLTLTETRALPSPVQNLVPAMIPEDMRDAQKALSLILAGGTSRCETPPEAGASPLPLDEALLRLSEGEEVWLRIAYPEGPCRRRTMILTSLSDAESLLAS